LTENDESSLETVPDNVKNESKNDPSDEPSMNLDLLKPLEETFFRPQESEKEDPDEETRDPEKLEDFGLTVFDLNYMS
jgi:hypothetical protein